MLLMKYTGAEAKRQRIVEMTAFLNEQLVRRLIEKVTVFDNEITVEFKLGVEIEI